MIWIVYSTETGDIIQNVLCAESDAPNQVHGNEGIISVSHFYRTDLFRVDLDTMQIVPIAPEDSDNDQPDA